MVKFQVPQDILLTVLTISYATVLLTFNVVARTMAKMLVAQLPQQMDWISHLVDLMFQRQPQQQTSLQAQQP